MSFTNSLFRHEILKNTRVGKNEIEQFKVFVSWLTDKRLKDKSGKCKTWDNDKEGVGVMVPEPITLEGDPLAKVIVDARA